MVQMICLLIIFFLLVAVVSQLSSEIPAHASSAGGHEGDGGDAAEFGMEGDGESERFPWNYWFTHAVSLHPGRRRH